jgi:hypothetical protein
VLPCAPEEPDIETFNAGLVGSFEFIESVELKILVDCGLKSIETVQLPPADIDGVALPQGLDPLFVFKE